MKRWPGASRWVMARTWASLRPAHRRPGSRSAGRAAAYRSSSAGSARPRRRIPGRAAVQNHAGSDHGQIEFGFCGKGPPSLLGQCFRSVVGCRPLARRISPVVLGIGCLPAAVIGGCNGGSQHRARHAGLMRRAQHPKRAVSRGPDQFVGILGRPSGNGEAV